MSWKYILSPDAIRDYEALDGSQKKQVIKALRKTIRNPLPRTEGGLGEPLGNKGGRDLTTLLKIKLLRLGLRIVYKLEKTTDENGNEIMMVVVIAARADEEVYDLAWERISRLRM